MKKYLILLFSFVLLCACSSTSGVTKYYYLPNSQFIPPAQINNATLIEVTVADYLATQSMILAVSQLSSQLSTKNLWAEDLNIGIRNLLSNELNELGKMEQRYFTILNDQQQSNRIKVFIERFQANHHGIIEVLGYANIYNQKNTLLDSLPLAARLKQQGDGYQNMVNSLALAIKQIAKDIYEQTN